MNRRHLKTEENIYKEHLSIEKVSYFDDKYHNPE